MTEVNDSDLFIQKFETKNGTWWMPPDLRAPQEIKVYLEKRQRDLLSLGMVRVRVRVWVRVRVSVRIRVRVRVTNFISRRGSAICCHKYNHDRNIQP